MKKQGLLLIVATLLMSVFALIAYKIFFVTDHKNHSVLKDSNPGLEADHDNPGDSGALLSKVENEEAWADVPLSFDNYQEMMQYHDQLEVAGYGSSTGGFGTMTALGQFTFFSAQIPGQKKFRVFVYGRKQETTSYVFVDNFLMTGSYPPTLTFATEGNNLMYIHETTGKMIKRKKIDLN